MQHSVKLSILAFSDWQKRVILVFELQGITVSPSSSTDYHLSVCNPPPCEFFVPSFCTSVHELVLSILKPSSVIPILKIMLLVVSFGSHYQLAEENKPDLMCVTIIHHHCSSWCINSLERSAQSTLIWISGQAEKMEIPYLSSMHPV